jgi:hypothetical protein
MRRFVEGVDRGQVTLFPECLEDWIDEPKKHCVIVIDPVTEIAETLVAVRRPTPNDVQCGLQRSKRGRH